LGFGVDFQPRFVVSDCLSLSEHSHAASHTVLGNEAVPIEPPSYEERRGA
jgi:hypothetical protein